MAYRRKINNLILKYPGLEDDLPEVLNDLLRERGRVYRKIAESQIGRRKTVPVNKFHGIYHEFVDDTLQDVQETIQQENIPGKSLAHCMLTGMHDPGKNENNNDGNPLNGKANSETPNRNSRSILESSQAQVPKLIDLSDEEQPPTLTAITPEVVNALESSNCESGDDASNNGLNLTKKQKKTKAKIKKRNIKTLKKSLSEMDLTQDNTESENEDKKRASSMPKDTKQNITNIGDFISKLRKQSKNENTQISLSNEGYPTLQPDEASKRAPYRAGRKSEHYVNSYVRAGNGPAESAGNKTGTFPASQSRQGTLQAGLTATQSGMSAGNPRANRIRKPPPLYIDNENDSVSWMAIRKELIDMGIDDFSGKQEGNKIILKVNKDEHHRKASAFLRDNNIEFFTYPLPEDKPLKVVLREIPLDVKQQEMQTALMDLGFTIENIQRLKKRKNDSFKLLPLMLVTLPRNQNSKTIYNITKVLDIDLTVEEYRGRQSPPQCWRCQSFFHGQSACNRAPKCVKCAGEHFSAECTVVTNGSNEHIKCANCGGAHVASSRTCPKMPAQYRVLPGKPGVDEELNNHQAKISEKISQEIASPTSQQIKYPTKVYENPSYAEIAKSTLKTIDEVNDKTETLKHLTNKAEKIIDKLTELVDWFRDSELVNLLREIKNPNEKYTTINVNSSA